MSDSPEKLLIGTGLTPAGAGGYVLAKTAETINGRGVWRFNLLGMGAPTGKISWELDEELSGDYRWVYFYNSMGVHYFYGPTTETPAGTYIGDGAMTDGSAVATDATPPTLVAAVSASEDGDVVTITITGQTGARHFVLYQRAGDADWTLAANRTGDGTVVFDLLEPGTYRFLAYSVIDGALTPPGNLVIATVTAAEATQGVWSPADAAVRNLIASCEIFQTLTETADAAAAAAFVRQGDYTPAVGQTITRPFALVTSQNADRSRRIGTDAYLPGGRRRILIELDLPAELRTVGAEGDAELWFKNQIGLLVEQMWELSFLPGYIVVRTLEIDDGPFRYDAEAMAHVAGCWLALDWGLE